MRALGFIALALFPAFAACGSDGTTPTVSGVFPSSAFLGRKVRVEVSGDATNWSAATTVNFGTGVTVDTVAVASPTSLFADVTVTDAAAVGLTDVVVTDAGKTFTLAQAFEIDSPIAVTADGTLAQGSVVFLTIANHDTSNPFDTTDDGSGTFANISVSSPPGTEVQVSAVTDFSITAVLLVDTDATAGALSVSSGPSGSEVISPFGNMDIAARTATAITAGTPTNGMETEAFGTQLFSFTPSGSGAAAILADVSTANPDASAQMIVLPASGKLADRIALTGSLATILPTAGQLFVIYFDNTGTSGYSYTLNAKSVALTTTTAETAGPNDNGAQAQAITLPAFFSNATLTDDTDIDVVSFTITAADIGKKVHVLTSGDPLTDSLVEVFTSSSLSANSSLGGPSDDLDFGENFVSTPIVTVPAAPNNKIFVKISASQAGFFDPTHNAYDAGVFLE